jgi:4a-hydroxytetrahydrobiopterin dehydratase
MKAALLSSRRCQAVLPAATPNDVGRMLVQVPDWTVQDGKLTRTYAFRDHYETLAFVNALAWISHVEDHHPELTVTYNRCVVRYDTHSVNEGKGGLSDNDFICAAKVDALYNQRATGA